MSGGSSGIPVPSPAAQADHYMSENLPQRIDRAALERIIQRAAELQTGEREIGDGLSPAEVLALGRDVGIPERYLQQAMLEERSRVGGPAPSGFLDRALGPAICSAQRVVRGTSEEVEQRLLQWMDDQELLAIQRQLPGRLSWEPLRGMQVAFRRSAAVLGSASRPFMLSRANLVSATISDLEPGYCHLAMAAELRHVRGSVVGGIAALGAVSLAAAAVLAVMTPLWWVAAAPLPLFLAAAWGVGRQYRPVVERTQLGVERALDHMERGDVKPRHEVPARTTGLVGAVLEEIRKALKPVSSGP